MLFVVLMLSCSCPKDSSVVKIVITLINTCFFIIGIFKINVRDKTIWTLGEKCQKNVKEMSTVVKCQEFVCYLQ